MNRKTRLAILFAVLLITPLCGPSLLGASGLEVPPDSLAKLLLKIISMENGLSARAGGSNVVIGLVGSDGARDYTGPLAAELEKHHGAKLLEKEYEVKGYPVADLARAFTECHVLFVAEVGGMKPSEIAAAGEGKPVIVFGREPGWIDGGLMVGVFLEDQKPKIVLNLGAARKAGLEFKNQLLKISRVIK